MHHLGQTRGALRPDHLLHTPDTFVRTVLPGMRNAAAIVHTAPAAGARFTQYTAEFEGGGVLEPTAAQRFVYVLEGEAEVNVADQIYQLAKGGIVYIPRLTDHAVMNVGDSELVYIVVETYPDGYLPGEPTWDSHIDALKAHYNSANQ